MQQADDGSFTNKFRRTGTQWAGPSPSGRSPLGRSPLGQRGYSATRGSPTPSAAAGWGSRDGPLPTKIEMDTMMQWVYDVLPPNVSCWSVVNYELTPN